MAVRIGGWLGLFGVVFFDCFSFVLSFFFTWFPNQLRVQDLFISSYRSMLCPALDLPLRV